MSRARKLGSTDAMAVTFLANLPCRCATVLDRDCRPGSARCHGATPLTRGRPTPTVTNPGRAPLLLSGSWHSCHFRWHGTTDRGVEEDLGSDRLTWGGSLTCAVIRASIMDPYASQPIGRNRASDARQSAARRMETPGGPHRAEFRHVTRPRARRHSNCEVGGLGKECLFSPVWFRATRDQLLGGLRVLLRGPRQHQLAPT